MFLSLCVKFNNEQEEAVSEAVQSTLAGVLGFIRDRQLDEIIYDHTAEVVTADISRIYATVDIRCAMVCGNVFPRNTLKRCFDLNRPRRLLQRLHHLPAVACRRPRCICKYPFAANSAQIAVGTLVCTAERRCMMRTVSCRLRSHQQRLIRLTRVFPFTNTQRYDPGHDESLPLQARGQLVQDHDSTITTTTITNDDSQPIAKRQQQRLPLHQKTGTLLPSPEPEPAPIDRWARGCVVARSADARDWVRRATVSSSESPEYGLLQAGKSKLPHAQLAAPTIRTRLPVHERNMSILYVVSLTILFAITL